MIKKLATYIKEYKKESILTPICMVLEVILEMFIPFLMASIIDKGLQEENIGYVSRIGVIMLILALVSMIFGVLGGKLGATASCGFGKNLRKGMFHNIQDFSFENIDKYSTAGLVTRLTTDVTNIQNAFQMILRMFVRAPITLICGMIMSFYINPKVALIFFIAIIFLGISIYLLMTKAHPYFKEVFKKYDDLNSSVQENLNGIRVVKAYVREEHEVKKFKKASQKIYDYFIKAEGIIIFNNPVMMFTMYTSIITLSWIGAKMIVSGTMTTGELMSLFTYCINILMSLMMLSMVLVMVVISKSSGERIVEVLEEKSTLTNCNNPIFHIKDGSIEFNNVNFSYGKDESNLNLENINFKINSGETIGIIGGTGSGKSTLVQLIPRLYDVTNGEIKVSGVNIKDYNIESLRNEVAMVLQKNVLFSGTINKNLKWGNNNASQEEIIHASIQAQAHEFIEKFPEKYETFVEQGGNNVSGGQKQRLCIARALLKKPKILILDDSTSAVDTKTDSFIRKAFKEDIPDTTKIIIAQRISSIQDSDKIIVLKDGKINAIGTHKELLEENEIYKEVYDSQRKGGEKNVYKEK